MRIIFLILCLLLYSILLQSATPKSLKSKELIGHRFLTFNTVIRVNQIEVARDKNVGQDERKDHTPARVIKFRNSIEALPLAG